MGWWRRSTIHLCICINPLCIHMLDTYLNTPLSPPHVIPGPLYSSTTSALTQLLGFMTFTLSLFSKTHRKKKTLKIDEPFECPVGSEMVPKEFLRVRPAYKGAEDKQWYAGLEQHSFNVLQRISWARSACCNHDSFCDFVFTSTCNFT